MSVNRKTEGFTLIELLVVIAIISLLSTLAIMMLNDSRREARDSKRRADIANLRTALTLYKGDTDNYPFDGCENFGGYDVCVTDDISWGLPVRPLSDYIKPLPEDPGGHYHEDYDVYMYMDDVNDQGGKNHAYVIFFLLEKNLEEGIPQEDQCNMGLMNFGLGDASRIWSTRCPE